MRSRIRPDRAHHCGQRIGRLEHDMFQGVLGTEVRREETRTSGLYECAFYFAA